MIAGSPRFGVGVATAFVFEVERLRLVCPSASAANDENATKAASVANRKLSFVRAILAVLFVGQKILTANDLDTVLEQTNERNRINARIYHTFDESFIFYIGADQ